MKSAFEGTIGLRLSIGAFGTRRKVSLGSVDIKGKVKNEKGETNDPKRERMHLSKEILKCKELEAIATKQAEIREFMDRQSVSSRFWKGVYLIPVDSVDGSVKQLDQFNEEVGALVEKLVEVYPVEREKAKGELGPTWNALDYPDEDGLRRSFYLRYFFVSFDIPGQLEQINKKLFKDQKEQLNVQFQEASEEIRQVLRAGLVDLIGHMKDRLVGDDRKPKIFRDSLVTNFRDYLDSFSPKNVTDDRELASLVGKCKEVLDGVDADGLRSSEALRKKVLAGIADVDKKLASLVVTKGARQVLTD